MKKCLFLFAIGLILFTSSNKGQVSGDFRSHTSGNWSNVNSWERYDGSSWVTPAPSTPTNSDGTVEIQNTHTVTVDASTSVDQATIDIGGAITINSGVLLTIADAIGTDLTINGTLTNSGTISRTSATFTIGSGGKYIHSTTTTANGAAWSSLNSNSDFEYQNTTSFSSAIDYGNLIINTGGNVTSSGNVTVSGNLTVSTGTNFRLVNTGSSSCTYTVTGNLIINGTGTFTGNVNGNGIATMNLGGSLSIGSFSAGSGSGGFIMNFTGGSSSVNFAPSSSFITNGNITIATSKVVTLGQNVSVSSGNILAINGTLDCGTNIISGAGGITVSSGATLKIGHTNGLNENITTIGTNSFSTSANYEFNGSAAQITGTSLPITINNLSINNSNGVTLSQTTTVNGTLTLSSGNISTSSSTLTLASSGNITGEASGQYLIGNLVTTQNVGIGASTFGGMGVSLDAGTNDLGDVTVTRVSGSSGVVTVSGKSGINRKWTISSTNPPTDGRNLTLSWIADDDNSKDLTTAQVWKSTDNDSSWFTIGSPANVSLTRSITVTTTSFSNWTVSDAANPLPVELSSFTSKIIGNKVNLSWQTATEVNNYGFDVERSAYGSELLAESRLLNADSWTKIGFVEGHGNSNSPKDYSFVDNKLTQPGAYYYRLKQIDNDGKFSYSKTISVDYNQLLAFRLEQNYPNPFNPVTTIKFSLPEGGHVMLKLYDALGREVRTLLNENRNAGLHSINFVADNLSNGVYYYKITAGNYNSVKKMIILK